MRNERDSKAMSKNFLCFVFLSLFAFSLEAATYYVSKTGNDTTGTGTISNPWATITKGQSMLAAGDTLLVRGGRYYESVELTKQGTSGSQITIKAYPGETPVLDGTEAVTGWTQCVSNEAFLTVQGVTNSHYSNIYKVKIHSSKLPTDLGMFVLFENLQHCRIARWPDQEIGYATNVSLFTPLTSEAYGQTAYLLDSDKLAEADNYWTGAWVDVWSHAANNFIVRRTIASNSGHKLYFNTPLSFAISSGTKPDAYSITNHPHALDTPGEFAHTMTPDSGGYYTFYLWPVSTADLSNNVRIASKAYGFFVPYKKYVTIDGFAISGYTYNGVLFYTNYGADALNTGAKVLNCVIEDCGDGIDVQKADYAVVDNCQIRRVGGDGVSIVGALQASVKNCTIEHTAQTNIYFSGCTKSSIVNNQILGSEGTHGNGIACYQNCDKILIANNYFPSSNLAVQDMKNLIVYANVFNYEEVASAFITSWGDQYGHTDGYQLYLNNTILGSSNNAALGLAIQNTSPYPQNYIINNIIDGCNSWSAKDVPDRSYNLYTGYGWQQDIKYGWVLQTGEIDGRNYSLNQIFTSPGKENGGNYTLIATSPVVGKGKNISALLSTIGVSTWFPDFDFSKDKAGNSWSATPSMGAYEYTSGGSQTLYTLTITSANGSVTKKVAGVTTTATSFLAETQVELTAAANTGYTFGSWTGGATGTTNPIAITMNGNKAVTANFTQQVTNDNFADAKTISGVSGQTTDSNSGATKQTGEPSHAGYVGGVSIWWYWTAPASGQVTVNTFGSSFDTLLAAYTGSTVGSLTAIASNDDSSSSVRQSQITFSAVSGTTYRIAVDGYNLQNGSIILNWNFTASTTTYTLAVTTANGTVTKSPDKTAYTSGETVTLTAIANAGYSFGSWTGSATGTTNPVTITMNGNKTVTANFTQNTYTLSVTAANGTVAKLPNTATYTYGQVVTLTATPNAGYSFASWTGSTTGTTSPVTVTIDGNKAVTANFTALSMIESMTAHWMLDENTGSTITDTTSAARTAALINDPSWGLPWANEDWVSMANQTQAIAIPASALQPYAGSIAVWIEPESTTGTQFIFGHVFNSSNRINLYSVAGKLAVGLGANAALQTNIADLTVGQVAHIALTWSGTSYAVYVNSVQKTTGTFEGLTALNTTLDIGNYGDPASRTLGFIGIVEDIRTYCRALTALEIERLYDTYDVYQQKTLVITLPTTDTLGQPISYQPVTLPAGAVYESGTFTWQPSYNQVGSYTIVFTASGQPLRTITVFVHDTPLVDWYRQFLIYTDKL